MLTTLLAKDDFDYVGAFRVPDGDFGASEFAYGGTALAYNSANKSLFIVGHDHDQAIAEISVPAAVDSSNRSELNTATVRQSFVKVRNDIPDFTLEGRVKVGGLHVIDGELHGTFYEYYDGSGDAVDSHFRYDATNLNGGVEGLFQVGTRGGGWVGGWIIPVAPEWQTALGAPYITGQGALSVINRTSSGPAAFGFDPDDLGAATAPTTNYVYYPQDNRLGWGTDPLFNGTTEITGAVMPPGTNSVLFFGRHGHGAICYGTGEECQDPHDSSKGYHVRGGDYRYQVWAYDVNDFVKAKNGDLKPWEVKPYTTWNFEMPFQDGRRRILGVAYDYQNDQLFVSQRSGDEGSRPMIHVFDVSTAPDTTPPAISEIKVDGLWSKRARITWKTDENADTQVEFGPTTNYGSKTDLDPALVFNHSVLIENLQPNTTYHYRVISKDAAGNQSVSSDMTFTTPEPDTTAPAITNVVVSEISNASARITWTTDEVATSQAEFGKTSALGTLTNRDVELKKSHSVVLNGLDGSTTYHVRVRSMDGDDNESISSIVQFTTTDIFAHFKFDEGAGSTVSGGGVSGEVVGAAWVDGKQGKALQFDGDQERVNFGGLDIPSNSEGITLSAWIKADDVGKISDSRIVSKSSSSSEQAHYWMLSTIDAGGESRLRFRLKTGTNASSGTTTLIAGSGALESGKWHHAAATYDGSQMKLYLDGSLVGSVQKTGAIARNSNILAWVGGNPPNALEKMWDGMIDDVRIYDQGLTAAQVAALANPEDTTGPEISNVSASNIDSDSATITWSTNESATSQVEYGLTTDYGTKTTVDNNLVTSHSVSLADLKPSTTYHFRVISKDGAGNSTTSADFTFTTAAAESAVYSYKNPKPLPAPDAAKTVTVSNVSELVDAVRDLKSGYTISIKAGTYDLSGVVNALYVPQGIEDWAIRGATGDRDDVVIKGAGMTGSVVYGFWIGSSTDGVIADLTIDGVRDHGIIANFGAHDILYHGLRIIDSGDQFIKSNPKNGDGNDRGVVQYSIFEYRTTSPDNYTNGVDVHAGEDWLVQYNLFENILSPEGQSVAGPAVLMWNGSKNSVVHGNTFINTARGISFGLVDRSGFNDHEGGVIKNNMFVRDPNLKSKVDVPVFVADSPNTKIYHNTLLTRGSYSNAIEYRFSTTTGLDIRNNLMDAGMSARNGASASTVSGNVTDAALSLFVNAAAGDLHLKSDASVIDQGQAISGLSKDLDGQQRDSKPDLGADEKVSGNQAPAISNQTFSIDENSSKDATVGTVDASDPDSDNLTFAITAGNTGDAFAIEASTGKITVNKSGVLDHEATDAYSLTVKVTDDGDPNLDNSATITINVGDLNERPEISPQTFGIDENSSKDAEVGTVEASDPDEGDSLTYGITAGNDDGAFAINATNGKITVSKPEYFDHEATDAFTLTVEVADGSGLKRDATITVNVLDLNESPLISNQTLAVDENSDKTTSVGDLTASDPDDGDKLTFEITAGNTGDAFAIDPSNGKITVNKDNVLDHEDISSYSLTVKVSDDGSPELSDTATVTINIGDLNEAPSINNQSFSVDENTDKGADVDTVAASDPDAGDSVTFEITAGNSDDLFAIDASTGKITVNKSNVLDHESIASYDLTVKVSDGGDPALTDSATVTIKVGDLNEAPSIGSQTLTVDENSAADATVGDVAASDPDAGDSLSYEITAGDTDGVFAINASTGRITVKKAELDHEAKDAFTLTVKVTDDGNPKLSDSATVTINVGDVNEAPTVNNQTFSVDENSAADTTVDNVAASDPDAGDSLSYEITAGNDGGVFAIDASTGKISVAKSGVLDHEAVGSYSLTVKTTDAGDPKLSDSATVTINVNDVNENPIVDNQEFTINENAEKDAVVGVVAASDPDDGDRLAYAITAGDSGGVFAIDAGTGKITLAKEGVLDQASKPSYELTLQVTDDGVPKLDDTATIKIVVSEVNQAPVIENQSFTIAENSSKDAVVGDAAASDPDGDALVYAITAGNSDGHFAINSETGRITVNKAALDHEAKESHSLTVEVTDNGTPNLSDSATITLNVGDVNEAPTVEDQAFAIDENSAKDTEVDTVVASDPDDGEKLTFAITAGNDGDVFAIDSATGKITLANDVLDHEAKGDYSLTVQVSDDGNPSLKDTATITIAVGDVNEAPAVVDQSFPISEAAAKDAAVGTVGASDPDDGDALTYAITAGNSAGLFAIDGATGKLTLNKAELDYEAVSSYNLTVKVTDSGNPKLSDTATVTILVDDVNETPVINAQTFSIDENPSNQATIGTISATDPDEDSLSYEITAGNASEAFSIDSDTGKLTVNKANLFDHEAAESYTLTVKVTDDGDPKLSDSATVTINVGDVNEAPTIEDQSLTVSRDASNGDVVGDLSASDPDAGDSLTFAIFGGDSDVFSVGSSDGRITVKDSAALATRSTFTISVRTSDSGQPSLSDTATVTINVTDDSIDWGTVTSQRHNDVKLAGESVFRMQASRNGFLTVEAFFTQANGDVDLRLFDANGNLVASGVSEDDNERIDYEAQVGEQVVLRVLGANEDVDFRLTNLVSEDSGAVSAVGTSEADVITLVAGSSHSLTVAGVNYLFSDADAFEIDGLGGDDEIVVTGPSDASAAEFEFEQRSLTVRQNEFDVDATGFKTIRGYSRGVSDVARMFGTEGNETFTASATEASLAGDAFSFEANGFSAVDAHAGGGTDTAHLSGSDQVDVFYGRSAYSYILGVGFVNQALGFDEVTAVAGQSHDFARLYDSSGADAFVADANSATFSGADFKNIALGFSTVSAYSSDGADTANLYDTSGNDLFIGREGYSYIQAVGSTNTAYGFPEVFGHASSGDDTAKFYGTSGDESFAADPEYAELQGSGFSYGASQFNAVEAHGAGGSDTAELTDSSGNDTFYGRETYGYVIGSGFVNTAYDFDSVTATASNGGTDRARLYDSAGNDVFYADPAYARFEGAGFNNIAKLFRQVDAYSYGGSDVAELIDSSGVDSFYGRQDFSYFTGNGFSNTAHDFASVVAKSENGGADRAYLFGSTGADFFLRDATQHRLSGNGFDNSAQGFAQTRAYGVWGDDRAEIRDLGAEQTLYGRSILFRLTDDDEDLTLYSFDEIDAYSDSGGSPATDVSSADYIFRQLGDWD